jgi:nucleoside-diphosphate-sugar epimerase
MKALVTGGGGFLGKAIVLQLLARGDTVRTLARGDYPELRARSVDTHRGDVGDAVAVLRAVEGCDVVFHIAAKAGIWGTAAEYEHANVQGTAHVIEACRTAGVERLVYASSPSRRVRSLSGALRRGLSADKGDRREGSAGGQQSRSPDGCASSTSHLGSR